MATEAKKLALCVLNWNGREVLPACLRSLEAAADRSRHRVTLLLVDNASTDGSDALAAAEHPRWEILRNSGNLGFAGGVNAGLRLLLEGDYDYLGILNNDVEAAPELLDPLVADLEGELLRGAACPRIHYLGDPKLIWYGGGSVGRWTRVSRHMGIRKRAEGRWLEAADTGYLTGCCILGRRQFWKTTGGFDEDFYFYSEDVDLSLRARALGWTLRYQPAALLYHRVGFASGGGLSPGKLRAQRQSLRRLLRRHVPALRRPLAYAAWGLHLTRSTAAAVLRGELGVLGSLLRSLGPGRPKGVL